MTTRSPEAAMRRAVLTLERRADHLAERIAQTPASAEADKGPGALARQWDRQELAALILVLQAVRERVTTNRKAGIA